MSERRDDTPSADPDPEELDRRVGFVAIGRNEGDRLVRCLKSIRGAHPGATVVYVDSGSTDGSVERARELGADVVELDTSIPFTAARARNAGAARLREVRPELEFVQFVDGDCELHRDWPRAAVAALDRSPRLAAVCGRLSERFPERSIYNALADLEWDGPVGEIDHCGGNAMYRREAFDAVAGFNNAVAAGEEPELCYRLRKRGWEIQRLPAPMALHDAEMTRFRQMWRRTVRAGQAYAQGAWLHGRGADRFQGRKVMSIVAWGVAGPLAILGSLACAVLFAPWFLFIGMALAAAYPLQFARLLIRARRVPASWRVRGAQAFWLVFGKFAEAVGVARFLARVMRGREIGIIEHRT